MNRAEYMSCPKIYAKRGEQLPGAKLTNASVRQMRADYGPLTAKQLAARHGVSQSLVEKVVSFRRWVHVR